MPGMRGTISTHDGDDGDDGDYQADDDVGDDDSWRW